MISSKLGTFALAKKNIHNKPTRSYGLMFLTGILCFILFLSSFMIISLKNGTKSLSNRMGADIIVVPEGYDSKITGAILRGEPNTFFLDISIKDRLSEIEGVEKVSPQIYLATLSAGCCSFPIQIIGLDESTDFTVIPWLSKQVELPLVDGEIIVGNNIVGTYNSEVKFFNQPFKIKGRLAKTGMGFDDSVFMSMGQTRKLAKEYEKILETPVGDSENLISSLMVKVKSGADVRAIQDEIRTRFADEGVYALASQNMMSEISVNMQNLVKYMYILIGLMWILALLVLVLVYSFSIAERKREFGTLRILGATKSKLRNICLCEAFIINAVGAVVGTCLSLVIAYMYRTAISQNFNLPFLEPTFAELSIMFLGVMLLGAAMGPLASYVGIGKMDKREMALLIKEND